MMKQRSKFFIVQIGLLTLSMAAPSFVYAEEGATSSTESMQTHFCASLNVATQKIAQNILLQEGKYANKAKERETRLEEKSSARERITQSTRLDTDATHDKVFAKLADHATTDSEKAAIEKFKQSLDTAIFARRASVDAAVETFNIESAKLTALRAHDIDNRTTTLRNATIKAENAAKANCKNGLAGTIVRTRYTRDLKNARKQFQADVDSALKRNDRLSLVIKNRDADIKKAVEVLRDTLATLRHELESNLKEN